MYDSIELPRIRGPRKPILQVALDWDWDYAHEVPDEEKHTQVLVDGALRCGATGEMLVGKPYYAPRASGLLEPDRVLGVRAYHDLRDPARRAEYDRQWAPAETPAFGLNIPHNARFWSWRLSDLKVETGCATGDEKGRVSGVAEWWPLGFAARGS